jgi:deazaflavin-dependent oxidoreductase (nitroreductase family)
MPVAFGGREPDHITGVNFLDWMEQGQRRTIPLRGIKDICMSHKPTRNNALEDRLSRSREINITVTGRKSGRSISIPVWFVLDEDKLYLLPVQGSDTQWYKNVLKKPSIRIDARGAEAEFHAVPITHATQVSSVVDKFRAKYGADDVKKYYSKFDVAVLAQRR